MENDFLCFHFVWNFINDTPECPHIIFILGEFGTEIMFLSSSNNMISFVSALYKLPMRKLEVKVELSIFLIFGLFLRV